MNSDTKELFVVVSAGGVEMSALILDRAKAKAELIRLRQEHPNAFFHLEKRNAQGERI